MSSTARAKLVLIGGYGGHSGVPTHIEHLVEALSAQYDIVVISDKNQGGYDFLDGQNIAHIEVPGLTSSLSPLKIVRAHRQLTTLLDGQNADIVWAHARLPVLLARLHWIFRKYRPRPGSLPKHIVTFHGLPFGPGHRKILAHVSRRLEQVLCANCPPSTLVFLTTGSSETYVKTIGADRTAHHNIQVLRNTSNMPDNLQLAAPFPSNVLKTIVMTGRDAFQKNLDAAAAIFSFLPDDYQLLLCGIGTETPALQERFRNLLAPRTFARVHFLGPKNDIFPYLKVADCYLLTSRYEGLSIGALEAFHAGIPVALSAIPGNRDLLADHPHSVSIDTDQPKDAALKIRELVTEYRQDSDLYQAEISKAWTGKYAFPAWKKDVIYLIQSLL